MRPGLPSGVMITGVINAQMSGRRWQRAERIPVTKYYAGECDYSELQFHQYTRKRAQSSSEALPNFTKYAKYRLLTIGPQRF